ncbi:MAG TPA: response regulator, partial [Myxococcota bacterium]
MTRILTGNLEDLDLDEIVRVIALSRRSGLLAVDAGEGKAELGFVAGRLVRARLQDAVDTVGALLVRAGLLDDDDLLPPPGVSDGAESLDELVQRVSLERGERGLLVRVDDALSELLASTALRVMLFKSGGFHFRVSTDDAPPLRYPRDTAITLPAGIDAEELAREARVRRQEKRADPLSSLSSTPRRAGPSAEQVELFLVDDDPLFLQTAEKSCSDAGIHVAGLASARSAIDRFFALGAGDSPSFMVVDLVMPRSSGKGILGGLEVLKRAADVDLAGRIFLALEQPHS